MKERRREQKSSEGKWLLAARAQERDVCVCVCVCVCVVRSGTTQQVPPSVASCSLTKHGPLACCARPSQHVKTECVVCQTAKHMS